jgi:hypothetical protein
MLTKSQCRPLNPRLDTHKALVAPRVSPLRLLPCSTIKFLRPSTWKSPTLTAILIMSLKLAAPRRSSTQCATASLLDRRTRHWCCGGWIDQRRSNATSLPPAGSICRRSRCASYIPTTPRISLNLLLCSTTQYLLCNSIQARGAPPVACFRMVYSALLRNVNQNTWPRKKKY